MVEETKKSLLKGLAFLGIFVVVMVVTAGFLPQFGLFTGKGAEKQFNIEKVELFQGIASIFLIGIVILKLTWFIGNLISREKAVRYVGWANIPILDFEDGLLFSIGRALKVEKAISLIGNPFRMFIWSLVIFSSLGILGVVQNTFLSEIPQFQVTKIGEGILEVFPASSSEWLGIMFPMGVIWAVLSFLAIKFKWDEITKWVIVVPSVILTGTLTQLVLHLNRYGGSELSLVIVAFFGFMSAILYLLFGGFLVAWILHPENNLFEWLNRSPFFSDETIILVTFAFVVPTLLLTAIVFEILAYRSRKKKRSVS